MRNDQDVVDRLYQRAADDDGLYADALDLILGLLDTEASLRGALRLSQRQHEEEIERLRSRPETPTGSEGKVGLVCMWCYQSERETHCEKAPHEHHTFVDGDVLAGGSTTLEERDGRCEFMAEHHGVPRRCILDVDHDGMHQVRTSAGWSYHAATPSQPEAPGETKADRQWRESGMWQEWLAGYERVSDDERAADPRCMSVERWIYRLLSTGHCPGSLPVAHAIIEDLDALAAPTHDMEALREALEKEMNRRYPYSGYLRQGWAEAIEHFRKVTEVKSTSPTDEEYTEALQELVDYVDRQSCRHEETHRGGTMWEICDLCPARWADDEGGKPEYEDPPEVVKAREILSRSRES